MATFKQMIQDLTDKFLKTQPITSPAKEAMERVAEKARLESEKAKKEKRG